MEVVEEEVVPASPTSAEDEACSVPEAAGITDSNFCFNASNEASGLQIKKISSEYGRINLENTIS